MTGPCLLDRKTVLVLSTGRSGSTWLATLLGRPFRYRVLFEPFQSYHVPGAEQVADRYYPPDQLPEAVRRFVVQALRDELDNDWIRQDVSRRLGMHRWRGWPRVRIVKDVRSNLFVPAYRALLGDEMPVVVIVRHPVAVLESFRRVKFPWATDVDVLLSQSGLQRDFGVPLDRLRAHTGSQVGCLAIRWVMENAYLLRHADDLGVRLLFYEDLKSDPLVRISELCTALDLETVPNLAEQLERPSHTTHTRSPLRGGEKPERPERLNPQDIELLEEIMGIAGVDYPR